MSEFNKPTNPPAFSSDYFGELGMTLRDYFAAKAMQGMVASCVNNGFDDDLMAVGSYRLADAMLKAREA